MLGRQGRYCVGTREIEAVAVDSRVGTTFGKYNITRLLGKGGGGVVYEAYDTGKGRTVALKILAEDFSTDATLTIEAAVVPGKGKLQHTGQLGEVMQESIQAAMTVVRSRAQVLGLEPEFYQKLDVHLHMPEGATPKDGPSAGIGMCTALVSALTSIPVRSDVAMTGEITLRGEVLPIGGLKEKLLAAHRGGIKTVLIPDENQKDLVEIPDNIKGNLEIKPVKWIDEVLARRPHPAADAAAECGCPGGGGRGCRRAEDKPARRGVRRIKQDVPPAH